MDLLIEVGKTIPVVLSWLGIIAINILAPSIGIWAIIKLAKTVIRIITK